MPDEIRVPHSFQLMGQALRAIQTHKDDPEDSLLWSITQRDLAIITFGVWSANRFFPEFRESHFEPLLSRVRELAEAQGWKLDA